MDSYGDGDIETYGMSNFNVEGFSAEDWMYDFREMDDEEVLYWVFCHKVYSSLKSNIDLELQPDGGYCIYVRWWTDLRPYEQACMTLEEAIEFYNGLEGN